MNKLLLLICLGVSSLSFGQKKLTQYVLKEYDDLNVLQYVDSVVYDYATFFGSLTSNEPVFGDPRLDIVPNWAYRLPSIPFTSAEIWSGAPTALTMETESKIYNASNQLEQYLEGGGTTRVIYLYNPDGTLAAEIFEENSGSWAEYGRSEYDYDGLGRTIEVYTQFPAFQEYFIDSVFYEGTTTDFNRLANYESDDDVTYSMTQQTITSFNGANQELADVYFDNDGDPMTPPEWTFQGQYNWNGNSLTTIDVFPVVNNVVSPIAVGAFAYTYDANNRLETQTVSGIDEAINTYTYDPEGFLSFIEEQSQDGAQNWYVSSTQSFTYQSTASLNEYNEVEFTVYPNPTSDIVVLEAQDIQHISVFNANGQLVMDQNSGNEVSLAVLPSGTYQIVVQTANGSAGTSVVKK